MRRAADCCGRPRGFLDESGEAKRRDALWLAALVVAAAAVRAIRWAQTAVMMNDGPEFIGLAQKFAGGQWRTAIDHNFHPLYPAAVALAHAVGGDWVSAGAAVSVAGGALAVAALWWLVREAFGRREAFVAATLLAVNPTAIELADVQSDALYLAWFVASAALLYRAYARGSARSAFAAGLTAGLAYLTRPEGVGTVVVGVALAGFEGVRRHFSVSEALRLAAPLCAGALLVMSPYVAYRSVQAGGLVLTGKKSVGHLLGLSGDPRPHAVDPLLAAHPELPPLPRGVTPFRDAPAPEGSARLTGAAVDLVAESLRALRPEGALLLAVGLLALRGRPGRRGRCFGAYAGLYAVVLFGLQASSGYLSRRHALPPLTLLLGYAAAGLFALAAALERVPALAPRPALRAALPLLLVAGLGLGKALRPVRDDALPERRAAEWIARVGGLAPGETVAAVKQRVGWYANAPFVDLRRAPHPALLLPFLRRERVRYVVVDAREREELLQLAHGEPDALLLRHTEVEGRHEAYVFELRG